jgi:hypothetical protein
MATCPRCGKSSRTDPTLMSLEPVWETKPVGSFSLAGARPKFSATLAYRLTCRCGWAVTGRIEDGQLVVTPNPTTVNTLRSYNN